MPISDSWSLGFHHLEFEWYVTSHPFRDPLLNEEPLGQT